MNNKTVWVTGGAGYIGSHTCMLLAKRGYSPITLDNLVTGKHGFARFGPLVEIDLRDRGKLVEFASDCKPLAIVHLAASTSVAESVVEPDKYWSNNLDASLNLLVAARSIGCHRLLFASSSAVYGPQDRPVLDETVAPCPTNAYAASKLAGEYMLENFSRSYDLSILCLRYFNVAGADPAGTIGYLSLPGTALVPTIMASTSEGAPALQVNGLDYDTPDGTCIRDYIHVMDVAEANCLAMEWLVRNRGYHVLNVGSERGYSIKQVITACEGVIGESIRFQANTRRPGDLARTVSDTTAARELLGFECQHSGIDTIVRDAWNWYRHGTEYN